METGWLQARQTRYTAYVTLYILIVIGRAGPGELAGEPAQQVGRYHCEQEVQSL